MEKLKIFFRRHRRHAISALLVILLIGGGVAAATAIARKTQELAAAQSNLEQANAQIKTMVTETSTLKTDLAKVTLSEVELKTKLAGMSKEIEAFAKQAAACEAVKKQLKIKK